MPEKLEINPEFKEALDLLENTHRHLFITGKAGTGKSTLLKLFREQTGKNLAVLAPTGVAAVNVGGETIHSFFRFAPNITPDDAREEAKKSKSKLYQAIEVLVIDEISMVRADLLDSIDVFLKAVRRSTQPFGGVQVVMIGDMYQLPPVVTRDEREALSQLYRTPYFFSAAVMGELSQSMFDRLKLVELTRVYRQTDPVFVEILNGIRNRSVNAEQLETLNDSVATEFDFLEEHIVLTSINEQADQINFDHLNSLSGDYKSYKAVVSGSFEKKQAPTTDSLILKVGARVMFLNNDPDDRWINGTIGTVTALLDKSVKVQIENGPEVLVDPFPWKLYRSKFNEEKQKIEKEEVGSFIQVPLRLAWAITIHKSQGKTFDKVLVDLGRGSFAHGQTYVALSRATSLEGLRLRSPLSLRDIVMDQRVNFFLNQLRAELAE